MMFYKDLLKRNEKNPLWVFIGLLFLVASIGWITSRLMGNESIKIFDWFYSGVFALNGLVHTMGGLGYPIEGFFGKAFIRIDSNLIEIKLGIFKKEQTIVWDAIQSIDYKANQLVILKNDNSYLTVALSKLEYSIVQEIKNIITDLAVQKGIKTKL